MTWLDEYKKPSFRGVPFVVSSHTGGGGRRVVTHQYPRSDIQRNEDLGADEDSFSIQAKVVGPNYTRDRSALENALRQGGIGTLVHPTYGELDVFVKGYSIREGLPNTGVAYFSMTFSREIAGTVTVTADLTRQVEIAAENTFAATEDWLDDNYVITGTPRKTIGDARDTLSSSFDFIEQAKQSANEAAAFKREISNAKGDIISLSLSGAAIARTYRGVITFTVDETTQLTTPRDRISELLRVYDSTLTPVVETSESLASSYDYPARQIQNALAYTTIAAITAIVPTIDYGSIDETERYQALLFDAIDRLSEEEGISDPVYSALRDCRATMYQFFDAVAIGLPRLIDYKLAQGDNALSLAYRLYGDLHKADEIVALNNLSHPGFVPQGIVLKVRTDE